MCTKFDIKLPENWSIEGHLVRKYDPEGFNFHADNEQNDRFTV
jgi:hypothetical protein